MEFMFILFAFAALFSCSKETPILGSTFPPEPTSTDHPFGPYFLPDDKSEIPSFEGIRYSLHLPSDRSNYSRQLTASTLDYDEWVYPTKVSRLSLKDFPGRPGVATWKEITPVSSKENLKSRKINGPTAAGVSSDSCSLSLNKYYQIVSTVVCLIFLLACFCRT